MNGRDITVTATRNTLYRVIGTDYIQSDFGVIPLVLVRDHANVSGLRHLLEEVVKSEVYC